MPKRQMTKTKITDYPALRSPRYLAFDQSKLETFELKEADQNVSNN
jgi:hypothetical protein